MIKSRIFLFLVGLSITTTLQVPQPARADGKSCVLFPLPGITCGKPKPNGSSKIISSCNPVTDTFYIFIIVNKTGGTVNYTINGNSESLTPQSLPQIAVKSGYYAKYKYPKQQGTNSCNVRTYPSPVITFYSSKGSPAKSYKIGNDPLLKFIRTGNDINIVPINPTDPDFNENWQLLDLLQN